MYGAYGMDGVQGIWSCIAWLMDSRYLKGPCTFWIGCMVRRTWRGHLHLDDTLYGIWRDGLHVRGGIKRLPEQTVINNADRKSVV